MMTAPADTSAHQIRTILEDVVSEAKDVYQRLTTLGPSMEGLRKRSLQLFSAARVKSIQQIDSIEESDRATAAREEKTAPDQINAHFADMYRRLRDGSPS
jgi:hypothetical protein